MSKDPNRPDANVRAPGDARFAIVWSRFNKPVVSKLLSGALECFEERGTPSDTVYVAEVPGAWELPYAASKLATSGRFDAVVALGAIIRGGTPHFDYVSEGTSLGLGRVSLDAGIPVVFGVLTTDDDAQALERAGGEHGNKGYDAALTAIEMTLFDRKLAQDGITTKRT